MSKVEIQEVLRLQVSWVGDQGKQAKVHFHFLSSLEGIEGFILSEQWGEEGEEGQWKK